MVLSPDEKPRRASGTAGKMTPAANNDDLTHSYVGTRDEPFVCFTAGTAILCERGEKLIETLRFGDLVQTMDHGLQPVRWIGRRSIPGTGAMAPICFEKGAIGNDKKLLVSPRHKVLLGGWRAELQFGTEEVLVAAKYLINGDTIYQRQMPVVDYVHILFDRHEIVQSNGCASESYHPSARSMSVLDQAARAEILAIFPELEWCAESYGETARQCLTAHETQVLLS